MRKKVPNDRICKPIRLPSRHKLRDLAGDKYVL